VPRRLFAGRGFRRKAVNFSGTTRRKGASIREVRAIPWQNRGVKGGLKTPEISETNGEKYQENTTRFITGGGGRGGTSPEHKIPWERRKSIEKSQGKAPNQPKMTPSRVKNILQDEGGPWGRKKGGEKERAEINRPE